MWRRSNTIETVFCFEILEEALSRGSSETFDTDQRNQFTSDAFTGMLLEQGNQVSMDGKGRYTSPTSQVPAGPAVAVS